MKKTLTIFLAILVVLALMVVGIRVFTPEDTWICENGSWQKHGNPSVEIPQGVCK
jgi:hypothetical protein